MNDQEELRKQFDRAFLATQAVHPEIKNWLTKTHNIMKKILMAIALCLVCAVGFVSCNKISNKSVFVPLTEQEKNNIQKADSDFFDLLENSPWNEITKYATDSAKQAFGDITYRELRDYYKFNWDTAYWNPLFEKWAKEYESLFPDIDRRFDSVMAYYDSIAGASDLSKYVKVELQGFDIDYYQYIGGVEDAYFIFKFTPLQGKIQQLIFNYKYKYKINEYGWNTEYCTLQNSFSTPYSAYYKIDYSEKDKFSSMTKSKFLERYDLEIEVTKILKDGEIIQKADLPYEIRQYYEESNKEKSYMLDYYRNSIIKEFINADYCPLNEYQYNKKAEIVNSKGKNQHIDDFTDWLMKEYFHRK